ncbi:biopolymer transporter ExbD [Shimia sp. R11_0]|uniref:Protein TolR n=1 Tax=Shimia marina TaxID=321267 RepID=A0A0P1EL51_9RHOB|nr:MULTISPECIES: biopolymer transporter ExbD [Shimia]MBO9476698.1 biopolymer transporter ExbD [Shimia sp. R11_0]CUH50861.1 protein TolR [Shimia marina]SFE55096.1 biopolymer transport protein ExbD [Shimia marina]
MLLAPPTRPRRKPSLTPMIDVVFLLLVFFMLASRFGSDAMLTLPLAAGGGEYSGPPRLIQVEPDSLKLNGIVVIDIAAAVAPLTESPTDTLILRGGPETPLQRIVDVTQQLQSAGFTSVVLVE